MDRLHELNSNQNSHSASVLREGVRMANSTFKDICDTLEKERTKLINLEVRRKELHDELAKLRTEIEEEKRSYHSEMKAMSNKYVDYCKLYLDDENLDNQETDKGEGTKGDKNKTEIEDPDKDKDFVEEAKKQAIKKELKELMTSILKDDPPIRI